jgi:hypothetical protein
VPDENRDEPVPRELWMLRVADIGAWLVPIDECRGAAMYIVCPTLADALAVANDQEEKYDIKTVPVRVK